MSGSLTTICYIRVPGFIIIWVLLCGCRKQFRNPTPCVCCKFLFGLPTETGYTYVLPLLCFSNNPVTTRAVVTFEVDHHKERMCPHGINVVMHDGFTPYYWAGSQWQLSKLGVMRWTWCNSAQGCISTNWTALIKHCFEVARYSFLKISLPSVVTSTMLFAVVHKRENSTAKDAGRISCSMCRPGDGYSQNCHWTAIFGIYSTWKNVLLSKLCCPGHCRTNWDKTTCSQ